VSEPTEPKKALNVTAGIALGAIVAGGAAFLYKTKTGKKLRRYYKDHREEIKDLFWQIAGDIKTEAKKVGNEMIKDDEMTVKPVKSSINRLVKKIKKRVFVQSGKPLVK
jgi:gas vesicle protein